MRPGARTYTRTQFGITVPGVAATPGAIYATAFPNVDLQTGDPVSAATDSGYLIPRGAQAYRLLRMDVDVRGYLTSACTSIGGAAVQAELWQVPTNWPAAGVPADLLDDTAGPRFVTSCGVGNDFECTEILQPDNWLICRIWAVHNATPAATSTLGINVSATWAIEPA